MAPVEIMPVPMYLDVGLIDIPTATGLAALATAQTFSQCGSELGFPVADRLMPEHDAADQEHLWQYAQAELVAQPPEHHEDDDVSRPVQRASTALVELLAASAAAEPTVILGGALAPLRNGRRSAPPRIPSRQPPSPRRYTHTRPNRTRTVARTLTEPSKELTITGYIMRYQHLWRLWLPTSIGLYRGFGYPLTLTRWRIAVV
jgi:hypothetical protein